GGCDGEGGGVDADDDGFDEFKATVVLEQLIRAADVGALLQDWTNSIEWSTRLYKELKNGHLQNRGENPSVGWYDNQIKFLDFYILPLAKNLGFMGVFPPGAGGQFARLVKANLARWIEEGGRVTEIMMKEDEEERKRALLPQRHRRLSQEPEGDVHGMVRRQQEPEGDRIESLTRPMGTVRINDDAPETQECLASSRESLVSEGLTPIGESDRGEYGGAATGGGAPPTYLRTSEHGESLTSSFKSLTSYNSFSTTSTTASVNNSSAAAGDQSSGSVRRRTNSSGKGVKKMVQAPCDVCGVLGRFSCPVCASPYCSAKCCREHKATRCSKK
ncbi:hypothetical protein ACHAWF_007798, partial [Thalassiosira exigua]